MERRWVHEAIAKVEADANRSADTHLIPVPLPAEWPVDLYLKDESVHPTGSLKHRLARSLVLYGLCNGWIGPHTVLVEASSGSTAVSEAAFARLIGLPFVAVVPASTSPEKLDQIRFQGGRCELVDDPARVDDEARRIAEESGGHFIDQFTYAERATDWRGNNNIAESIFEQMRLERHPVPRWLVVGAGRAAPRPPSGATSATAATTPTCAWSTPRARSTPTRGSSTTARCARPHPRASSRASAGPRSRPRSSRRSSTACCACPTPRRWRARGWCDGCSVGASARRRAPTCGARCKIVAELLAAGDEGSVVSLICDPGDRYEQTIYNEAWLADRNLRPEPYEDLLDRFLATGEWPAA